MCFKNYLLIFYLIYLVFFFSTRKTNFNLITLFSSQSREVLTNIKYRRALRARVKKIMDYQLGEGVVSRVFFQKWVFQ